MKRLYLDNAASTPIDPRVWQAMTDVTQSEAGLGHASAQHYGGYAAASAIERAAEQLAALLQCAPDNIVWTSGATQSIDWALQSAVLSCSTEHSATLAACAKLKKQGNSVTIIQPDPQGRVSPEALARGLQPETRILSIMHVNNETGLIQDIAALGHWAHEQGLLFHVDATQSVGKLPIDMSQLPIDMLSGSGHKFHGPKGIGFLVIKQSARGFMPASRGTLPTELIVGLGVAAEIAAQVLASEYQRITALSEQLWDGIKDLPGMCRHIDPKSCSPYILNVRCEGIPADQWMEALPNLAMSAGAACNSSRLSSSTVLKSLGLTEAQAKASLRFSFGRFTTTQEIDCVIAHLRAAYPQLRAAHQWWVL